MNEFDLTDEQLDRRLRDIPQPDREFVPRLLAIAAWADEELDLALNDVPVSSRLRERLHAVPQDALVGAALAAAEPAHDFLARLHELVDREAAEIRNRKLRRRFFEGLLSLSLGLILFVAYGSFAWNSLAQVHPHEEPLTLVQLIAPQPPSLIASIAVAQSNEPTTSEEVAAPVAKIGLPPFEPVEPSVPMIASSEPAPAPAEADLAFTKLLRSGKFADSWLTRSEGSPPRKIRPRNGNQTAAINIPRGISESSSDYDRAVLVREGVHLPISPTQKQWRTSRPPLSDETSGFERTLASVARGVRPAFDEVRTEDFIASLRYEYESKSSAMNLIGQAGPSPFGDPGTVMLHLGVKAPPLKPNVPPIALAIVLDRAGAPDWEAVIAGAAEFLARLREEDRVSFVVYAESVQLATEPLTKHDAARLRSALAQIKPSETLGDAVPAWEAALESMARSQMSPAARQAIVHVGTLAQHAAPEACARLRFEFEQAKIAFAAIDFGEVDAAGSDLAPIALSLGDSAVTVANTRRSLVKAFLTEAFGPSAITARSAKLEVTFDPAAVASYRLLGHEADAFGRIAAVSTESDLMCGDEATVLYEVRLRTADSKSPPPAVVSLKWRDPITNKESSARRSFARSEFFTAWDRLSDAFRRSAAAAEVSEWLRESRLRIRETGGSRLSDSATLRQSLEAFPPSDRRTADDDALLNLVKLAEKAKARPRNERK